MPCSLAAFPWCRNPAKAAAQALTLHQVWGLNLTPNPEPSQHHLQPSHLFPPLCRLKATFLLADPKAPRQLRSPKSPFKTGYSAESEGISPQLITFCLLIILLVFNSPSPVLNWWEMWQMTTVACAPGKKTK